MTLYQIYKSFEPDEFRKLAKSVEVTPQYLSIVARGHRRGSVLLAKNLEKHIGHLGFNKSSLRSDIFEDHPTPTINITSSSSVEKL